MAPPGAHGCAWAWQQGGEAGANTCRPAGSPWGEHVPSGASAVAHSGVGRPSVSPTAHPALQPPVQPQPKRLQLDAPQVPSRPAGGGAAEGAGSLQGPSGPMAHPGRALGAATRFQTRVCQGLHRHAQRRRTRRRGAVATGRDEARRHGGKAAVRAGQGHRAGGEERAQQGQGGGKAGHGVATRCCRAGAGCSRPPKCGKERMCGDGRTRRAKCIATRQIQHSGPSAAAWARSGPRSSASTSVQRPYRGLHAVSGTAVLSSMHGLTIGGWRHRGTCSQ